MAEKTKEELEKELADLEKSKGAEKDNEDGSSEIEKLKLQLKENAKRELDLEKEKMKKEMEILKAEIASIKETSMTDKQKEESTKIMKEQAEQTEKQRLLDTIEELKVNQLKDKLDKSIIEKIVKEPHLKGHVEHVNSTEELDALIKREGESWKRLHSYENGSKKNKNVTNGYRINKTVSDGTVFKNKTSTWTDKINQFLPKNGLANK